MILLFFFNKIIQSIASGEECESVAEKLSKQRTTAYTGLLAHATDAQPRITLINIE